jgi:hypothetical protein
MGNTRDTGYLQNLVTYDASGNIVLPANLTVNGNLLVATQSYVTTQINNLINGAPALLDTLDELAAALGDDANFASTITTSIAGKQTQLNGTGFVKVTGTTVSYDNSTYLTTGTASSTYVPYTGATTAVDLGTNDITSRYVVAAGAPALGGVISMRQDATYLAKGNGYSSIASSTVAFDFFGYTGASTYKNFTLRFDGLTNNTRREYILPDADGTLALTSQIPANPVGGTGSAGQVAYWSSSSVITGESNLFWDATNDRLGVGTNIPVARLQLNLTNAFPGTVLAGSGIGNAGNNFSIITTDPQGENVGGMITFGGMRNSDATNVGIFGGIRGGKENNTSGNTSGNLGFYTLQSAVAFAERMRITSVGNVGIGTTTPNTIDTTAGARSGMESAIGSIGLNLTRGGADSVLLLQGGTYTDPRTAKIALLGGFGDGGGRTEGFTVESRASGSSGNITNSFIISSISSAGASERMTITSSSTTIIGDITTTGSVYSLGNLAAANGNQSANTISSTLFLGNRGYFSGTTIGAAQISAISTGTFWYSGTAMAFYTNPGPDVTGTANVERMRITSGGNVGIGTDSPEFKLDVAGGDIALSRFQKLQFTGGTAGDRNRAYIGGNGNNDLIFAVAGGAEAMRIHNSTNVLIGTTTDAGFKLYIVAPSAAIATFTGTTNGYIDITDGTVNSRLQNTAQGFLVGTVNSYNLNLRTNNTIRLTIDGSSGNVLIPGNIQFNSIISTDYTISLAGITAGAWFNIPEFNFNSFSGLVTIRIQNFNADYGYFTESTAWIFQATSNNDPSYDGLRGVTIRPDGTSQEGYNVVESYHTSPNSGRYNMRMRLRPRNTGSGAANPINLQIMVDNVVSITAGATTLRLKRI